MLIEREESVQDLELLGLSSQAHRIHHGDEDGYVAQGAAHAACYTDAKRITGAFGELHCSGLRTVQSWREVKNNLE